MRRPRDDKPEARERWKRAAAARRQRTDPNLKREYLRDRRFRFRDRVPIAELGHLSVVTSGDLRSPLLYYINHHGAIHREKELSAEELIRRYEAATIGRQKEQPCQ